MPNDPFVVFGASKSGTTWVQLLLDAHPQVRCHFQVPIFPLDLVAAGLRHPLPIAHHPTGSAFGGIDSADVELARHKERYLRRAGFMTRPFLSGLEPISSTVVGPLEEWHRGVQRSAALAALHDSTVGEATIVGTKAQVDVDLLFEVFPDARLVHVARDGRDVVVSKRHHDLRSQRYLVGDESTRLLTMLDRTHVGRRVAASARARWGWFGPSHFARPTSGPLLTDAALEAYARDWMGTVRYMLAAEDRYGDRVHRIRYEDLLDEAESEAGALLGFLGADRSRASIQKVVDATDFERLRQESPDPGSAFFRSGSAGDWRNHLAEEQARRFAAVAGAELIALGYEP